MTQTANKRVLVTGANSMLGVNVLERLLELDYEPVALVRHLSPEFDHLSVPIIRGNVTKIDDLRLAAADCSAIIHIAASTDQHYLSLREYLPINVDTVRVVAEVAREKGVRLVLVSSANTVGNGIPTRLADETFAPSPPFSKNLYAKSKIMAEQVALSSGAEVVIINPTFIIGAHDSKPSSGQAVIMAYGRRVVFAPIGGKNFVAARDVASAVVATLTRGTPGERYLAAGPPASNLSFYDFYTLVTRLSGRRSLIVPVPRFALLILGAAGSLLRLCHIRTQVSITNMDILSTREYYSSARAVSELGMTQTSLSQALSECVEWFKQNNMLKH